MMLTRSWMVAAALSLVTSCVVGDDPSDAVDGDEAGLKAPVGNLFDRVVVGRLYQTEDWMLPAADTYQPEKYATVRDRRIHYVCDALVKLKPTYVSGLVRLAWDTKITDDMAAIFNGVKQCVRAGVDHQVRFDVVLNALHYTVPKQDDAKDGVANARAGADRLRERMRQGNTRLEPDVWFFDFYTKPFNQESERYFPGAMTDGIAMIHQAKLLVGGNVWGNHVPKGTDFAAIPLTGGFEGTAGQIAALADEVPTFVHIRNDPQVCDSEGVEWFHYQPNRRANTIEAQATKQDQLNVGYMYPLFFPLSPTGKCITATDPNPQVAYDAVADGQLDTIKQAMDKYEYRPRPAK